MTSVGSQAGEWRARFPNLLAVKAHQAALSRSILPRYDYVVCGAGSAACALVGRLAADRSKNILLIEAGGWNDVDPVMDPTIWYTNFGSERAWNDPTPPDAGINGRSILQQTGRVLGGGSSTNAACWVRPFKSDYDFWAAETNDERWGYEHALSIYRRVENWQGAPDNRYRGKDGPVWVQPVEAPSPVGPSLLEAARALGLPILADTNGAREETNEGFGLYNHIIRDGQRQDMAVSYLYPVLDQDNVTLLLDTRVERIVVERGTATGVEIIYKGERRIIAADREIVICGGGICTPRLLMLSGIGHEDELKAVGIDPVVHSPQVGKNLQDHILHGGCIWEAPRYLDVPHSGPEAIGFVKSRPELDRPDICVSQLVRPFASDVVRARFDPPETGWTICPTVVAPMSRGEIRLKSSNPGESPIVQPNYLSHPDDVVALIRSIELCRELGNSDAMRHMAVREVAPAANLTGEDLVAFARDGASTFYHPSGTCRMGSDSGAVVDSEMRVNGVEKLRIADSSIMPRIPGTAIMAACVHIGERMAEILQETH